MQDAVHPLTHKGRWRGLELVVATLLPSFLLSRSAFRDFESVSICMADAALVSGLKLSARTAVQLVYRALDSRHART